MRRIFLSFVQITFSPVARWLVCWGLGGILLGLGGLVIQLSRVPSYLSNASETCINCHVMTDAYLSWRHSSHALVAGCNDCHVPQDSLLRGYWFKATDGLRHATIFTLRWEPEVIRLSERAKPVVQANCRRCHQHLLESLCGSYSESACSENEGESSRVSADQQRFCWDCHRYTPHERVHSLFGVPDVFRPRLPPLTHWDQTPTVTERPVRSDPREGVHSAQTK